MTVRDLAYDPDAVAEEWADACPNCGCECEYGGGDCLCDMQHCLGCSEYCKTGGRCRD